MGWKRAAHSTALRERFEMTGESLVRVPAGYDAQHQHIADLKRKDYVVLAHMEEQDALRADFLELFTGHCRAGSPFMRFLCAALDVPF